MRTVPVKIAWALGVAALALAAFGCGSREVVVENDRTGLSPEATQQLDEMSRLKQQMEQQHMQQMQNRVAVPLEGSS